MSLRLGKSFDACNASSNFEQKLIDTSINTNENCEAAKITPEFFEIQTDDYDEIFGEPKKSKKPMKNTSAKGGNLKNRALGFFENQHYPEFDSEKLLDSENGVKALPYPIDFMETYEMSYEQSSIAAQIGIRSIDKNGISVLVVKASNAYTIYHEDSDREKILLIWAMDGIELVKKVKSKGGLVYIDILITDDYGRKKIRVPMSMFDEKNIKNLQKYGVKVSPMYYFEMSIYFQKIADKMPMEDADQVIGVLRDTSSPLGFKFNGYTAEDAFVVKNDFASYKDYITAFNKLLAPSKPLQYLLSATMAAPILTLLQQKYNYDIHSYCINIVGASSTGKTICSRVCASAWTNPTDSKIFRPMHATTNAALKRLSGRYGIPTFLDEATAATSIKPDEYAYAIYNSCDKNRLNSNSAEKESGTWSTIVCMSSETHFHSNRKNQNGGLAVRVHSIEDLEWTVSKEHAEKLNQFISNNYGVLGKKFTEFLFSEQFIDSIEEVYSYSKKKMADLCNAESHCFTDRLCQTYALTYMAGLLLRKIGAAIDVEAVADIMVNHHNMVGEEQSLAKNAFHAIVSYVTLNGYRSTGIREYKDQSGRVNKVAVEVQTMNKILSDAGFADTKVTMKQLAKAGYLIRQVEKGLKSKLTIGNTICWCYQIDLSSMMPEKPSLKELIDNNDEDEDYELDFDEDAETEENVDAEEDESEFNEDTEADEDAELDEYVDIDWSSIPITFQSPLLPEDDVDEYDEDDEL